MYDWPYMELQIDPDVKAVAEFMQEWVPAARLVSVVGGLAAIAPVLSGRYPAEEVTALKLSGGIPTCWNPTSII